jgi:primosomal protein N' (replication factor Y)
MRLVRVAVPVPALDSLSYSVPEGMPDPVLGARVLVPLGTRIVTGCVIETWDPGPATGDQGPGTRDVKPLIDLLDSEPFLPEDVLRLTAWVAEYYACGLGEAIATAMPPRAWIESERHATMTEQGHGRMLTERGMRRELLERLGSGKPTPVDRVIGNKGGGHSALVALERDGLVTLTKPLKGSAAAFRTTRVASLTAQGIEIAHLNEESTNGLRLGERQREALALLRSAPDGLDTTALGERGISSTSLARLSALGLIAITRRRVEREPFEQATPTPVDSAAPLLLTADQQSVLDRLASLAACTGFQSALLHGVTGSGKTEIYLRLAAQVLASGRNVLLLVPEIALTPAVTGLFRRTFGNEVAIQHSGLSDGERYDQWHRIRRGEIKVVVGTRSAVFSPLPSPGLIIVDEEHDGSYKQEEAPRYNGRDVAVMRARLAGALVVLGSATPSMESYQNALTDKYTLVTLKKRVMDRPLAAVQIVDMRAEYAAGGPDVILSEALLHALRLRLGQREQAMVLLNRRGFATTVFCRQCAATLECPNCSVTLTVHRAARRARCHYCNYSMPLPKVCANCAGPYLEQMGFGTERVEAEILAHFPEARVARVDRDTIRKRGAIAALLGRFAARELDILVGTQMIAKGHDFPRVTLVGVISADVGLGLADFRAAERTFQLLTQVAGRAGRGEIQGNAIVQTLYPNHYSIRHACKQDYEAFFNEEINFRRAMRYPPSIALINVIVKGRTLNGAMHDSGELVRALRWGGEPYKVLGPATAPLTRLKGEHRVQFFMKGTHRTAMREALQRVLESRPEIRRRTIVDVDPMSVL